jgi:DNA-binding IclR family transcriptional regulator
VSLRAVGAVHKAFRVIRLLRQSSGGVTQTEIARSLGMAPSTARSILDELVAQGVVILDRERGYRLGPGLFELGAVYATNAPIYASTWHGLVGLSDEVSLTAVIAVPLQQHHLILNVQRKKGSGVEVTLGGRVPIDAGAWGKAYFAWPGQELPSRLTARTPQTITDPELYAEEIRKVRGQGYAVDLDEFVPGVGTVAAGVGGEHGLEGIAALVGLISEINSAGVHEVGRRLAGVASWASHTLGDRSRAHVVGED